MPARTYASPDDIDITSLLPALKRSLLKVVVASLLVGALTFAVFSMVAPKYVSEAQLSIAARSGGNPFSAPRPDGSTSDSVAVRMDKQAINTHVRALKSADLAAKVAKEFDLKNLAEFNSALGPVDTLGSLMRMIGIGAPPKTQSVEDRVLNAYFKKLNVYAPKESRFIVVGFESLDPQLAANIANSISAKYRVSMVNMEVVENDQVLGKLRPEIERLMAESAKAQAEVKVFRGKSNLFKGGKDSTGLNQQQLAELTAEYSKAKAARSSAEARMRSAREMYERGSADALADVQRSPIVQNLVQQRVRVERQISELSATLLPGHPRMKQLYADLRGIRRQVKSEVGKVVDSLEKEAKVAALREESISKSLTELKATVVDTGPDEVKLANLEAVSKAKRSELERVQAQYEAAKARAQSGAVPVEAHIISRARAASVPSAPKKLNYALLASFATFLFGIAGSILGTLWGGARSGPAQARFAGDLQLSTPPSTSVSRDRMQPQQVTVEPSMSTAPVAPPSPPGPESAVSSTLSLSSIAELAGRLEANSGQSGYRTLVTSDVSNLNAREEAVVLAKELASARSSVILIDWSPNSVGMAGDLGVANSPGLNDLFAGSATFQDVIQAMPESAVHFIATGAEQSTSDAQPLDPDKINLVLDALDEAYNNIIVVADHDPARQLFEVIEGRFDAGVTVTEPKGSVSVIQDPPGTFLGFQVADIDIIALERKLDDGLVPGRALLRGMRTEEHDGAHRG